MNQEYKVHLSQGQKAKLAKAIKDGSALKLRLSKNSLSGNDELFLSPRQIAKLQKAKKNNTGAEISFSKSAIRKSVKQGGSLWTSLLKLTPFLTKGVSKVAPHLATGALSALGSLGIDKIFGKGMQGGAILPDAIVKMLQRGIEVPVKFLVNLINLKEMFTNAQKTLIGKGLQSGKGIVLKPTKRQIHGGLLGTLAAIGIPMAIELGVKNIWERIASSPKSWNGFASSSKSCSWPSSFTEAFFMATSPLLWHMEGAGKRKGEKRKRTFAGRKQPIQPNPHLGSNSLSEARDASHPKPKWKDIPLSNFDLLKWVEFLKIKNFKGIFSRDSKDHLHRTGSCIINLDDEIGNGTHWVATDIKGKNVFYFDSFAQPPPVEFVSYAKRIGKQIIFNSGHPIQELQSVRCGYYCLYFLNEIRRKSFYDVLKVFSLNDPMKNERFIKIYFH